MTTRSRKLEAGAAFPPLAFDSLDHGRVDFPALDGWRLLVVYRGKHCPLCVGYLNTLNALLGDFRQTGVEVYAISADPQERAREQARAQGWQFPVGYGLSQEDMHRLGLYVSAPRSADETDRPFSEPGTFLVNPEGNLQIVDISNAPFARPDLAGLLKGIQFIQAKGYPIRGTL